jgi:hypothetical protein
MKNGRQIRLSIEQNNICGWTCWNENKLKVKYSKVRGWVHKITKGH